MDPGKIKPSIGQARKKIKNKLSYYQESMLFITHF